jgi:hypothetical protein
MTLPKQEWRRKEAPQHSMVEPAADGQTVTPGGQTTANSVLGGQTTTQSKIGPTTTTSSPHIEAGGPTTISCKVDASSGANMVSSPAGTEEDTDDDLLDYEPSPVRNIMEITIIYLSSTDYSLLEEEEVSQLALGPQDAIFKKPVESGDHLKPLYIRGHLDGTPLAHMLVDGGTVVNVMPYSTFKKLGKTDAELIKTNMTITGIRGDGPSVLRVSHRWTSPWGARRSHCILHRGDTR